MQKKKKRKKNTVIEKVAISSLLFCVYRVTIVRNIWKELLHWNCNSHAWRKKGCRQRRSKYKNKDNASTVKQGPKVIKKKWILKFNTCNLFYRTYVIENLVAWTYQNEILNKIWNTTVGNDKKPCHRSRYSFRLRSGRWRTGRWITRTTATAAAATASSYEL